ncbi:MAG: 50S ribosomal protein L11 methyltransferase [Clostridiales bacterium]|jgi:ribosomal protein L11 methyltransferase|nr:50S ribosomal protein L11 methyltransferase [Clostridiales bacterium]
MEWIQGKIYAASDDIEPLTGLLMERGVTNTQIDDVRELRKFLLENPYQWDYIDDDLMSDEAGPVSIIFWTPSNPAGLRLLADIRSGLSENGYDLNPLILDYVDDSNWLNNWKKYFKPIKIGGGIVVRPEWEDYEPRPGETVFTINPGHVFGTGLHQTTQMCIECLERYVTEGCSILDLGSGSGILSIIGALLGAGGAFACDLDPAAADVALQNARLNNISLESYKAVTGNAITDERLRLEILGLPKFDIIIANIVADVVIALTGIVAQCIRPDGVFISSGIIRERLHEVKEAVESRGFIIIETSAKDDWYCLAARYA